MSQFKAQGLARLLANVEREVLVEALDIAGMNALITTDTVKTIAKMGQALENLDSLRSISTEEDFFSRITLPIFGLSGVMKVWGIILRKLGLLDDLLALVGQEEQEEEEETKLHGRVRRILREARLKLVLTLSLDHEEYHPTIAADERISDIAATIQRAINALS